MTKTQTATLEKAAEAYAAQDFARVLELSEAAIGDDPALGKAHFYRALAILQTLLSVDLKRHFEAATAGVMVLRATPKHEAGDLLGELTAIFHEVDATITRFIEALDRALDLDPSLKFELSPEALEALGNHWAAGIGKLLHALHGVHADNGAPDATQKLGRRVTALRDAYFDILNRLTDRPSQLPGERAGPEDLAFPEFDLAGDATGPAIQLADDALIAESEEVITFQEAAPLPGTDSGAFRAYAGANAADFAAFAAFEAPDETRPHATVTRTKTPPPPGRPPSATSTSKPAAAERLRPQLERIERLAAGPAAEAGADTEGVGSARATRAAADTEALRAAPDAVAPTDAVESAPPTAKAPRKAAKTTRKATKPAPKAAKTTRKATDEPSAVRRPDPRAGMGTAAVIAAMPEPGSALETLVPVPLPPPDERRPKPRAPEDSADAARRLAKLPEAPLAGVTKAPEAGAPESPPPEPPFIAQARSGPFEIRHAEPRAGRQDEPAIRERLTAWARNVPGYPVPDLGTQAQITRLSTRHVYSFRHTFVIETRVLKQGEAAYRQEKLPLVALTDDQIQRWQYRVGLPLDFGNHHAAYRLSESYERVTCSACLGRGVTPCGACEAGRVMCPKCDGHRAFPPEADESLHPCPRCSAEGDLPCEDCEARGTKPCPACDASGARLRYLELHVHRTARLQSIVYPGEHLPLGFQAADLLDTRYSVPLARETFTPYLTAKDVVRLCPRDLRPAMVELATELRGLESVSQKIRALALEIAHSEVLHVEYTLPEAVQARLGVVEDAPTSPYSCNLIGIDQEVYPGVDPMLVAEDRLRRRAVRAQRRGRSATARRLAHKLLRADPGDAIAREIVARASRHAKRDYQRGALLGAAAAVIANTPRLVSPYADWRHLLPMAAVALAVGALIGYAINAAIGPRLGGRLTRLFVTLVVVALIAFVITVVVFPPLREPATWLSKLAEALLGSR